MVRNQIPDCPAQQDLFEVQRKSSFRLHRLRRCQAAACHISSNGDEPVRMKFLPADRVSSVLHDWHTLVFLGDDANREMSALSIL